MVVMTGPSGSGKSTILKRSMADDPRLSLSVSHTTRAPRPGEQHGSDYHFVSDDTFDEMIAERAFAEWAAVHLNRYGTSKAEIERLWEAGKDIVFDIDIEGAKQLMATFPDALSIFIAPPNFQTLEARLRGRGTESAEALDTRLDNARGEIAQANLYRYIVVNDELDDAVATFQSIIAAERRQTKRVLQDTLRAFSDHQTDDDPASSEPASDSHAPTEGPES